MEVLYFFDIFALIVLKSFEAYQLLLDLRILMPNHLFNVLGLAFFSILLTYNHYLHLQH